MSILLLVNSCHGVCMHMAKASCYALAACRMSPILPHAVKTSDLSDCLITGDELEANFLPRVFGLVSISSTTSCLAFLPHNLNITASSYDP